MRFRGLDGPLARVHARKPNEAFCHREWPRAVPRQRRSGAKPVHAAAGVGAARFATRYCAAANVAAISAQRAVRHGVAAKRAATGTLAAH